MIKLHKKFLSQAKLNHYTSAMASTATNDPPQPPPPPPVHAETVDAITTIYKSLPPRPTIEQLEAATAVLQSVETEQSHQLDQISKEIAPKDASPELFTVLQEMKKTMVLFRSHEQRKEAAYLVELDRIFQVFDELIQKASVLVSGDGVVEKSGDLGFDGGIVRSVEISEVKSVAAGDREIVKGDDLGVKVLLPGTSSSSSNAIRLSSVAFPAEQSEKLDLMMVAGMIEKSAKRCATILDFRGRLMDKIEWLPLSLGKLSTLTELYISENRIMALPNTIGDLHTLMKLDAHANQIINLPSSFGELQNLTDLDLSANMLKSLPESFGNLKNLTNLNLSSNRFSNLPSTVGDLVSLQRLNVEMNDLEELPHTIALCTSLLELRLDFNQLKALPEAVGKLECLEVLTLHYNRVKKLPTTMGNLLHLRELDVSFNEIESIPETLCFEARLEKLNVGRNFADLRMLPESIGNLHVLEELDISDNQIKVLPDSFRFLSRLRNFKADQTPLEHPPKQIVKLGAQAVVQYMSDFVAERTVKAQQTTKKRGFCSYICPLLCFGIDE